MSCGCGVTKVAPVTRLRNAPVPVARRRAPAAAAIERAPADLASAANSSSATSPGLGTISLRDASIYDLPADIPGQLDFTTATPVSGCSSPLCQAIEKWARAVAGTNS
jgi:hypothetical protein